MPSLAADPSIVDLIRRKLEGARTQLIDRNLRNKLVNCALTSKRAKQIRIVDEVSDEIFRALAGQKKELSFSPGRRTQTEESENSDLDFAGTWVPPEDDAADIDGVARRHRDNALQTQLTAEGLQKRLTSLYYESTEIEEEQGVNVLYLALGFLKWFEDAASQVERYAPLLLLPVELTRAGARDRFKLKIRDEDLYTNVSLKVWLAEQHSIRLPDLPDSEDLVPSSYFASVAKAVQHAARWEVKNDEILLGFFSFSKFLLWRDLDPKNWPNANALLGHDILQTLLAPQEEQAQPDPPVIPNDSRIDDHFKAADQVCVLDADSSQTVAIQTALSGRNLVIQGPPGTGKSQTIANIIAAAIHRGKSVLFVAEKLAALQVVYDRLKSKNLGPLCFELHSRKAAKQQVLAQLRESMQAAVPPGISADLGPELDKVTGKLWAHSDRLHRVHEPGSHTPFQIIGLISRLKDRKVAVPDFKVNGAESWTRRQIDDELADLLQLKDRLLITGIPARHPWRGSRRGDLNPLDGQRLAALGIRLAASVDALMVLLRSVWPLVRPKEADSHSALLLREVEVIVQAFVLASSKPDEPVTTLCNVSWPGRLKALDALVETSKRLAQLEGELSVLFVPSAWARDWTDDRAEIAATGQVLLRFLRSRYRAAIRAYRGVCKAGLPKGHVQRLESLDRLIECQNLRQRLNSEAASFANELGPLWKELPGGWSRLEGLSIWLHTATELESRLSVRNVRLLEWSDSHTKWAERLRTLISTVHAQLQELVAFVQLDDTALVGELTALTATVGSLHQRAQLWSECAERYNEWPPVREGLLRIRDLTTGDVARRLYDGTIQPNDMLERAHLAIAEQIWNQHCINDPELARMDGRILDNYVRSFRDMDARRIQAAALEVSRKHYDRKPTGSVGEMAIVRGETNKVRKLLPVRKLLDNAGHAIQQLKPLFLMSPLSVAQYLSPGRLNFDLLLIDEASQVRPEDALGAIARAGQVVVVGDPKQLPPTNFFNRIISDGDEVAEEEPLASGPQLGAMESILSLCDSTFSTNTMLSWHYRSHHPALIAVSNRNFYRNQLLLPPSVMKGHASGGLGVFFRKTPSGGYDRGKSATNVVEAELVAEAVCEFARLSPEKSLGVGTFSVAQRDAIRDLIDKQRRADPSVEPFFSPNRPEPFFVKNLESIQGDERDVIFISVGYGRDRDGRLTQNFGPIGRDGGERRLNVLISRARERCEAFSPITADDIDVSHSNLGIVAFKEFLQFAEKGYFDIPRPTPKTFDSDFEESVAEFLRSRGFSVDPQVGMAGFYIDLGVLDPSDHGKYILGIECDGATYHSSRSARDRDRIRQSVLESRGWTIHRVWSTDWFHRRLDQERRLIDALARCAEKKGTVTVAPEVGQDRGGLMTQHAPVTPQSRGSELNATCYYSEATFSVKSDLGPHEADPNLVDRTVLRIVEIEGPIYEDEIARRLASVWGFDRAGSRIQDATKRALARLRTSGKANADKRFWGVPGRALIVRDRSKVDSLTLRKPECIAPAEIAIAVFDVLRDNVRVQQEDLVVEITRRLGFLRTGADLQSIISAVIQKTENARWKRDPDGFVTLTLGVAQH